MRLPCDLSGANFDRKWRALRKEAGLLSWVHDGLRHTFATMHYAAHQNAGQLKALMGHTQTEETLFRHYRAVQTIGGVTVSKKMAAQFWGLTPKRVKLPLPADEICARFPLKVRIAGK